MQTLSKNKISHISSLQQKKFRTEHNEFIVEGKKSVEEFIRSGFVLSCLVLSDELGFDYGSIAPDKIFVAGEKERQKISALSTAPDVLAVFKIKKQQEFDYHDSLSLVLDGVRDPGNLGTIIRTADWFGIQNIFCSLDSVDCYNPKVVQATMGSLARINIVYTDLIPLVEKAKSIDGFEVMGAFMNGENIAQLKFSGKGFLVMGNESDGIRNDVEKYISQKISIPKSKSSNAESLNVSVATAVLCYSLTR
jgi:TrmH family RNA methyltransferase